MIYRTQAYTIDPDEDSIELLIELDSADHPSRESAEQWLARIGAEYALTSVYDRDPDGFPPPEEAEQLSWDPGYGWNRR